MCLLQLFIIFRSHRDVFNAELRELRRRSAIRNVVVNSFRQAIITVIVPVLPINERIRLTDLLEYLPEFERAELVRQCFRFRYYVLLYVSPMVL